MNLLSIPDGEDVERDSQRKEPLQIFLVHVHWHDLLGCATEAAA